MEHNKILLVYENNEILLVNLDNERCENRFEEKSIKDDEKKICMLKNGNFLILNANKKIISLYKLSTKNSSICTRYVRVHLNVLKLTKNEKIIFGGDKTGNVYIWSAITGLLINSFQAHFGIIKDILIDQTVNVIYTYSDDNIIHVYNLPDLFRKKNKIKPMLFYQHNINSSIKQIISVSPNCYDTYYTLISLTSNGEITIWGLKSKEAMHVLKTNTENCTYVCTNDPFNTHIYLCKGNKIYRIPFAKIGNYGEHKENNCSNVRNKCDMRLTEYSDYVQIKKGRKKEEKKEEAKEEEKEENKKEEDISTNDAPPRDPSSNFDQKTILKKDSSNELRLNLKNCTVFIGHKNDVIKCYVNDKKQIMISLAKDGIKLWDIYNCYAIKNLKYGENIANFYIPTFICSSYLIDFPNLLVEYEDDIKINIMKEVNHNISQTPCIPFLNQDENILINMATMFAGHQI
ncbi:WD repeat-containing protein [Plasmodium brasilianum]|uniref:WD repeat-containing protein, putative n=2 Tax=Plasmodium (Plasmodium) TaxID=418103 RepID=A0A1A8X5T9_PLAMA|nr:WD repeat-containing protein, putative [Plasmodium malariae]KAI4835014.1 WD repeat-containing protein [Plasmodium brasilianum]SBS99570.1 WD repeat-containing protein, putative [Plasmodium malariae]SCP03588.1 WD repeat-containing protein, putative [Plasmodium malariae]